MVIDTGRVPGFVEGDWRGADLAVGAKLILELGQGMPRCVTVDRPQAGANSAPAVLTSIGEGNGMRFGLRASATTAGLLNVGDTVTLRRPTTH